MRGGRPGHAHSQSQSGAVNNQRAQLANAYQELGKELSSERIKVVGNYTLGKVIGEGAYGKVRIGTHRLTSTRVAIKQIPKALSASLTREIHHHRRLHHPNVTQLFEVIATESSIWLITELCSGGELYDYLVEKGRLSELETRQIFGELCLALHYVHVQGVVHRDLKLENVLLDERCHVKLSDFGFTREFEQGRMLETYCGTTGYAAPEMLQCKKYMGSEVDVWSLGVILYCLLVGTLPFDDDDEEIMRAKIIQGDYTSPEWLSADVQDLIKNLLQKDPSKRLTVAQTLAHPWFSKPTFEEPDAQPLSPPPNVIDLTEDVPKASTPASQPGSRILNPIRIPSPSPSSSQHNHEPTASSVASDATTFHSATSSISQSDEGADLPTTPADSLSGMHDFARTANSVEEGSGSAGEEPAPPSSTSTAPGSESSYSTIHRMESQSTIRKMLSDKISPVDSAHSYAQTIIPTTVLEEDSGSSGGGIDPVQVLEVRPSVNETTPLKSQNSASSLPPSSYPTRTPARTKRRSVSSNLTNDDSPPASPTLSPPPIAPLNGTLLPDYLAESHLKAPLAFSTELERNLLSTLSLMGFDTGQIVHSVLTDACDSASSMWWMLKKKVERRETRKIVERAKAAAALEDRRGSVEDDEVFKSRPRKTSVSGQEEKKAEELKSRPRKASVSGTQDVPPEVPPKSRPRGASVSGAGTREQTSTPPNAVSRPPVPLMLASGSATTLGSSPSAPDVTLVPATPLALSHDTSPNTTPRTPPASNSGSFPFNLHLHSYGTSPGNTGTSTPTTPGGSGKRTAPPKQRATSVSMLQRATTALSAAGLTRKKSTEAPKDETLASSSASGGSSLRPTTANGGGEERPTSSGSNKLTKSPPNRDPSDSQTDSGRSKHVPSEMTPGSPWAFPNAPPSRQPYPIPPQYNRASHSAPTPANSPGVSLSRSSLGAGSGGSGGSTTVKGRNRASILAAFRTWFNEDKRNKRSSKQPTSSPSLPTIPAGIASSHSYGSYSASSPTAYGSGPSPRSAGYAAGSIKGKGKKVLASAPNRPKRPSISSRRSSSVNSRRSSLNSINHPGIAMIPTALPTNVLSRQRSDASRRSRTPTSERDLSSRPSSVRSISMTPMTPVARGKRHSKSSSTSSGGSATAAPSSARKITSPMQQRRAGSSSSTRVIRQQSRNSTGGRPAHVRSDSQASSIRSRASSRPGSFHEASESEGTFFSPFPRTGSPMLFSRRSSEDARPQAGPAVMVAHRKSSLFGPPSASGRSSWKKSWGPEPLAWSSRSMQSPPELPLDPSRPNIRDVFSGRTSMTAGDDSDWVDEDDDEPTYVGGLGQASQGLAASTSAPGGGSRAGMLANASSSGPAPGSPSVKTMDLPPLVGMRNRQAPSSAKRNTRPVTYKPADATRHPPKAAPPSVSEEPVKETVISEGPGARSRRQLPTGRGGSAFNQAIQEEDEDEEEE